MHDHLGATRMILLRDAIARAGSDIAVAVSVTEMDHHRDDGTIDVVVAVAEHRTADDVNAIARTAALAVQGSATVPVRRGPGRPAGCAWGWNVVPDRAD